MAVVKIATIQRWAGHSGDEKPHDPPPPEGSEFHVVDTGEQWVWHNGMWVEDQRMIYAVRSAAS